MILNYMDEKRPRAWSVLGLVSVGMAVLLFALPVAVMGASSLLGCRMASASAESTWLPVGRYLLTAQTAVAVALPAAGVFAGLAGVWATRRRCAVALTATAFHVLTLAAVLAVYH